MKTQDKNSLGGFLSIVVSVSPQSLHDHRDISKTLAFGTPCYLFRNDSDDLEFQAGDGIVLSLLPSKSSNSVCEEDNSTVDDLVPLPTPVLRKGKNRDGVLGKRKVHDGESSSLSSKKKLRKVGVGLSVVYQLHTLVLNNCLDIVARVVGVFGREGNVRAVLLIDVYLPLALQSGWQLPKCRATAASFFKHLRCNWEQRNAMVVENCYKFAHEDTESIWTASDCHVLACKVHSNIPGLSKKKQFELHEIFKSLPGVAVEGRIYSTRITPADSSLSCGIGDVSDDVLVNVLASLGPTDLVRLSATCRHLRSLALPIMPCMKLKLFPHQQGAVEWMLRRERNAELLPHPLYMEFSTEDGFQFYVSSVSGEIATGIAPTVADFRGGMFCDEPGLGKTITALSLILKTQGTLADPPDGAEVIWCTHNNEQRCGYYELSADILTTGSSVPSVKRVMGQKGRQGEMRSDRCVPLGNLKPSSSKRVRSMGSQVILASADSCPSKSEVVFSTGTASMPATRVRRCTRSMASVKRNLFGTQERASKLGKKRKARKIVTDRRTRSASSKKEVNISSGNMCKKPSKPYQNETWVQCDACSKWRLLSGSNPPDASTAWFCSMNNDQFHQSCASPEESWDYRSITYLPGFYMKGTSGGKEENVSFFMSVLKEHFSLMTFETKRALTWLAKLSERNLMEMETVGLTRPVLNARPTTFGNARAYHTIFQAFGLVRTVEKGTSRWYYPKKLENLAFDLVALQIALTKPLDLMRLYLSRATLIVVPANLIDHWLTQIHKHVRPGQLRVYVWADHKKPKVHNLAWDYDIVITTFNRLSAEWGPRKKKSVLTQVHWHRVMLDEGHTLGSSLSLTNKLQMAIALTASNRWLLTGTPTPNTPNSQISHLQPLLRFLHEEAYGQSQKSWESAILRPFEAEMEEGRLRLLHLLKRCMISARKVDLQTIPPCIKKVVLLDFTEEHARSYNELVVTVRRNILMADWNDPSHVESLLNPKQWKFRTTTIKNVRLSCCVAGHIKVSDAGEDIQETMDILVQQGLELFSEEYITIKISLLDGGNCMRCKEWCRLPVITPCRHLLCLDCVAQDSEKCTIPGCGNLYEMQSPQILTRPENPNPKWPVPKDLIELQPSYKQDDWDPDWHATSSSKVAYLVERLKCLQEANKQMGYSLDGNAEVNPSEEHCAKKIPWNTLLHHGACSKVSDEPYKIPPEKVIIFSQFLEHIHVIEQQLKGAGIRFAPMYSPMQSNNKMKSLATFQYDENCMALLMDGSAALGLDLSFVSHVFLMEPIWDRSMEEQVISRAHRMGATRPINVETLAMRGTIEEQMLEFLRDANEGRRTLNEEPGRTDREGPRTHRTLHDFAESNYLAHLSFVRTSAEA